MSLKNEKEKKRDILNVSIEAMFKDCDDLYLREKKYALTWILLSGLKMRTSDASRLNSKSVKT